MLLGLYLICGIQSCQANLKYCVTFDVSLTLFRLIQQQSNIFQFINRLLCEINFCARKFPKHCYNVVKHGTYKRRSINSLWRTVCIMFNIGIYIFVLVSHTHQHNFEPITALSRIILFSDNVHVEWSGQDASAFKSKKSGRIFLTTHRIIFNSSSQSDEMQSFSFPFITLSEVRFHSARSVQLLSQLCFRLRLNNQFLGQII